MRSDDWDDDSAYEEAVERAERVTHYAWSAIGLLAGAGLLAVALAVLGALAFFIYVLVLFRAG